ncbi:MAG: hypothetical protein PUC55_00290 [Lachnospiraceae bacterium]|nr:hypothetical protein [Lachnospiraceae bacterium]
MKNIRRMMLGLCLVIGLVCGNVLIVQAEEEVPTKVIDGYVCEWQDLMDTTTILGYKGIESVVELAIPSELGGRKVDAIGYGAFKYCIRRWNIWQRRIRRPLRSKCRIL